MSNSLGVGNQPSHFGSSELLGLIFVLVVFMAFFSYFSKLILFIYFAKVGPISAIKLERPALLSKGFSNPNNIKIS